MEKLTEKINTFKISKSVKEHIIEIADLEEINIQQGCRKLLKIGIDEYLNKYFKNIDKK